MMCSTAAVQVCLDAGRPERIAARWTALHSVGPVLLALFANSPRHAGVDTGWASTRMRSWLGMEPQRPSPVPGTGGPTPQATREALAAPGLGLLREGRAAAAPSQGNLARLSRGGPPAPPSPA